MSCHSKWANIRVKKRKMMHSARKYLQSLERKNAIAVKTGAQP